MLWAMENWSEVFALSSETSSSCVSMSRSYVGLGCVACSLFVVFILGFVPHAETPGMNPLVISPFGCHRLLSLFLALYLMPKLLV